MNNKGGLYFWILVVAIVGILRGGCQTVKKMTADPTPLEVRGEIPALAVPGIGDVVEGQWGKPGNYDPPTGGRWEVTANKVNLTEVMFTFIAYDDNWKYVYEYPFGFKVKEGIEYIYNGTVLKFKFNSSGWTAKVIEKDE